MSDIGVDEMKAAVVAIDCHRGHLDPEVATMPAPPEVAERLIEANRRFLGQCRERGVPIVHLVTSYRDVAEIRANPFWRTRADNPHATRKNVERHNIEGSVGTDLDLVLKSHGVNTLLITGINTNRRVLANVAAANVRDYAPIVVEDCADTMDGPELHDAALLCIRTAPGWVMTSEQVVQSLLEGNR